MAKKSSIWSGKSRYGTYKGERGSPEQWASTFSFAFESSDSIQSIVGMKAYSIFGLQPTATDEEVKKAYRKFARIHHPDKGGNPEEFQKYTKAYEIILNMRHPSITPPIRPVATTPRETREAADDQPEAATSSSDIIIPQLLTSIDEDEVQFYLTNDDYGAQEKKDGKHLTLQIHNGVLYVRNKKGDVSSCMPEFEPSLRSIRKDILIDGEQVNGKFWTWDILEFDNVDYRRNSYQDRYFSLSQLSFGNRGSKIQVLDLAIGTEAKTQLYNRLKAEGKEGIVFKKLSGEYKPGKGEDQVKFKFYAECSVIVAAGRSGKSSIGMELLTTTGVRKFVGYCSCCLHPLPVIGSVSEIKYLYAYKGGCLYQPAFKELRDDVDVNECTFEQLKYKSEEE